jgi:hypothetical protein
MECAGVHRIVLECVGGCQSCRSVIECDGVCMSVIECSDVF